MSDESNGGTSGVSRRDLLSGAAAALAAAAVTGTPARLLASTDDWRVDLSPPRQAGNGSMLGVQPSGDIGQFLGCDKACQIEQLMRCRLAFGGIQHPGIGVEPLQPRFQTVEHRGLTG
jgi:hypothetical protein